MTRFRPHLMCVPLVAAALLALGSCGGSPESASAGEAEGDRTASDARGSARSNEPGPPDTFVPYRCSVCACRVFTGEGAYCNRPSCQHRWSDHQRPPE